MKEVKNSIPGWTLIEGHRETLDPFALSMFPICHMTTHDQWIHDRHRVSWAHFLVTMTVIWPFSKHWPMRQQDEWSLLLCPSFMGLLNLHLINCYPLHHYSSSSSDTAVLDLSWPYNKSRCKFPSQLSARYGWVPWERTVGERPWKFILHRNGLKPIISLILQIVVPECFFVGRFHCCLGAKRAIVSTRALPMPLTDESIFISLTDGPWRTMPSPQLPN